MNRSDHNRGPLTEVKPFPATLDRTSQSSPEVQIKAVETIVDLCKRSRTEDAIKVFTALPFEQDRAKVLFSLIGMKISPQEYRLIPEDARRKGFTDLRLSPVERTELIRRFFKAYYETATA